MKKLSEYMRLGALLKPQAFGGPLGNVLRELSHTCALAAAAEAAGHEVLNCWSKQYLSDFGHIDRVLSSCPVCCKGVCSTGHVVAHLNDHHRWSREQIADWVETIERAQEQEATCNQLSTTAPALASS